MQKLAIIGASYLQLPLINKAKEMGLETHVFAWKCGDVGEKAADYFYPISITEVEQIYERCKEVGIDGICTIASDLAVVPVNYVSAKMGLIGNSIESTKVCTNKAEMRKRFQACGDPSPTSFCVNNADEIFDVNLKFPVIVKPLDRSGSRGITKVNNIDELDKAITYAKEQGFEDRAVVEEYLEGDEYSVEYISFNGNHEFLALTKKFTTGSPNFIERGHLQPAKVDSNILERVKIVINHALDSLDIKYGASHSEIKIDKNGNIGIIEIGARMGGDFIGSNLVELSTGFDFVSAVINVALGIKPKVQIENMGYAASVFIIEPKDIKIYEQVKLQYSNNIILEDISNNLEADVVDSSSRHGYYIIFSEEYNSLFDSMCSE